MAQHARRELDRIKREHRRRTREVDAAKRKNSGRRIRTKDSDARARLGLARVTGKDAQAGKMKRQLDHRLELQEKRHGELREGKTWETGRIDFTGEVAHRHFLLETEQDTIPVGERTLHLPSLTVSPMDRIGVQGPNGIGKSLLLNWLQSRINAPEDRYLYLPQELEASERNTLLEQAYFFYALVLIRTGEDDTARQYLTQFLAQFPGSKYQEVARQRLEMLCV